MRKFIFVSAAALMIGACVLPVTFTPAPNPNPVVDSAGTAESMMETAVIQTLNAQPSVTPVIAEATVTATVVLQASASPTATAVSESNATLAAIDTASPEATGTFEIPTATEFSAVQPPGVSTATLTPGVLTYGTLPPAVPFSQVTLINRAGTQAYISLQVTTAEGGPTILEYPVSGQIRIKAPIGHYLYVAWVGGRKMVGEFRLRRDDDLSVILYRDRIEIK
jgi:hypothetical protein